MAADSPFGMLGGQCKMCGVVVGSVGGGIVAVIGDGIAVTCTTGSVVGRKDRVHFATG